MTPYFANKLNSNIRNSNMQFSSDEIQRWVAWVSNHRGKELTNDALKALKSVLEKSSIPLQIKLKQDVLKKIENKVSGPQQGNEGVGPTNDGKQAYNSLHQIVQGVLAANKFNSETANKITEITSRLPDHLRWIQWARGARNKGLTAGVLQDLKNLVDGSNMSQAHKTNIIQQVSRVGPATKKAYDVVHKVVTQILREQRLQNSDLEQFESALTIVPFQQKKWTEWASKHKTKNELNTNALQELEVLVKNSGMSNEQKSNIMGKLKLKGPGPSQPQQGTSSQNPQNTQANAIRRDMERWGLTNANLPSNLQKRAKAIQAWTQLQGNYTKGAIPSQLRPGWVFRGPNLTNKTTPWVNMGFTQANFDNYLQTLNKSKSKSKENMAKEALEHAIQRRRNLLEKLGNNPLTKEQIEQIRKKKPATAGRLLKAIEEVQAPQPARQSKGMSQQLRQRLRMTKQAFKNMGYSALGATARGIARGVKAIGPGNWLNNTQQQKARALGINITKLPRFRANMEKLVQDEQQRYGFTNANIPVDNLIEKYTVLFILNMLMDKPERPIEWSTNQAKNNLDKYRITTSDLQNYKRRMQEQGKSLPDAKNLGASVLEHVQTIRKKVAKWILDRLQKPQNIKELEGLLSINPSLATSSTGIWTAIKFLDIAKQREGKAFGGKWNDMKVYPIAKSGDSMFQAIAVAGFASLYNAVLSDNAIAQASKILRKIAVAYHKTHNWQQKFPNKAYFNTLPSKAKTAGSTVNQRKNAYVAEMSKNGVYAGKAELEALGHALPLNFEVLVLIDPQVTANSTLFEEFPKLQRNKGANKNIVVRLTYIGSNHFDAVIPRNITAATAEMEGEFVSRLETQLKQMSPQSSTAPAVGALGRQPPEVSSATIPSNINNSAYKLFGALQQTPAPKPSNDPKLFKFNVPNNGVNNHPNLGNAPNAAKPANNMYNQMFGGAGAGNSAFRMAKPISSGLAHGSVNTYGSKYAAYAKPNFFTRAKLQYNNAKDVPYMRIFAYNGFQRGLFGVRHPHKQLCETRASNVNFALLMQADRSQPACIRGTTLTVNGKGIRLLGRVRGAQRVWRGMFGNNPLFIRMVPFQNEQELVNMQRFSHLVVCNSIPHFPITYGAVKCTRGGRRYFLVLAEPFHGTMRQLARAYGAKSNQPSVMISAFVQLMMALGVLHGRNIRHGAITPDNVVYFKFPVHPGWWVYRIGEKDLFVRKFGVLFALNNFGKSQEFTNNGRVEPHCEVMQLIAMFSSRLPRALARGLAKVAKTEKLDAAMFIRHPEVVRMLKGAGGAVFTDVIQKTDPLDRFDVLPKGYTPRTGTGNCRGRGNMGWGVAGNGGNMGSVGNFLRGMSGMSVLR